MTSLRLSFGMRRDSDTRREDAEIRSEIFRRVRDLYEIRFNNRSFLPGETPVKYAGRVFDERELINLVDASLDFWLTAGRYSEEFEFRFAEYFKVSDAILTNSGSSANLIALSSLTSPKLGNARLHPGDEVITIAAGFPTTVAPIIQNGLIPVFVDVDVGGYNAISEQIEEAIGRKTRAIFMAHTLGNPFEVDAVLELVRKYNLWLIEDNCDAVGSTYRGELTGTFGHLATASFYPAHHMTMGEGGCVLTSTKELARIARSFRDWGRDCWCALGKDNTCGKRFDWEVGELPHGYDHKYIYSHIGYNLRVTDMQAAIGVAQLEKLPDFIKKRKDNFNYYFNVLKKYEEVFVLPKAHPDADPSWFGFVLTVKDSAPFGRDEIVTFLEDNKIATRMLFAGNIVKQPAYMNKKRRIISDLHNTDTIMNQSFWIGVYPGLTSQMRDYVVDKFEEFLFPFYH